MNNQKLGKYWKFYEQTEWDGRTVKWTWMNDGWSLLKVFHQLWELESVPKWSITVSYVGFLPTGLRTQMYYSIQPDTSQ